MHAPMSDEEIYSWYLALQEFHKSGLTGTEYCRKKGYDYKQFSNNRYRIEFKSKNHPELHKKLVELAELCIATDAPRQEFCIKHKISHGNLRDACSYIRYNKVIEERKKLQSTREPAMNFISIAPKQPPEPEVVPARNDIEIIIIKGVRVIISPDMDSLKIIKIIELLKDL